MSCPHLLPELLDHVVGLLHPSRDTLKSCCLVSKQWIPRTRKYLFAYIQFRTADDLQSWKVMFPNPSTSPACYAKALFIACPSVIAAAAAIEGCWVSAFSCVVQLNINLAGSYPNDQSISLVPFHGFSPALKSLRAVRTAFTHSQIFNLICSFPLLEDVCVPAMGPNDEQQTVVQPSSSPVFTGSLEFRPGFGTEPFAPILLSLPGGLHFRRICFTLQSETDVLFTTALVEGCCSTLESLNVCNEGYALPQSAQVNLSKATNLKDLVFKFWFRPRLLLTTLRTVTSDHRKLEQVTLAILSSRGLRDCEELRHVDGGVAYQEWLELDRLVAQLDESHSIRLKVLLNTRRTDPDGSGERRRMGILLPEVMASGIVDLVSSIP